jgi:hypothetical protein
MQKLLGTSSIKNYKSCGIFHLESNKIEFAFFWFLYNFLCNLQEIAKCTLLFENHFARRSLKSFRFSRIRPWFTKISLERMGSPQLGLSPWPAAVMAKIRRGGGQGRWGEVRTMFRFSPATDLWLGWWRKGGRQGYSAAPSGGRRWSYCSGERSGAGCALGCWAARVWRQRRDGELGG